MALMENRRRQRSTDPLIALHYQLAHVRQESQLDAIVVADDAGLVVAGAGAWAACEELAAYAPLLARNTCNELDGHGVGAASRVAEMRAQVDVQPVAVEGQTVLICARGGAKRGPTLDRAATGVARILRRVA
jgi:hypothetical protein